MNVQTFFRRLQSLTERNRSGRRHRRPRPAHRQPQAPLEVLEDRALLAAFVVDTEVDESDGVGTGGISLRDAINEANNTPGPDDITFAPGMSGSTILLSNGQLQITDDVTITGPGAAGELVIDAQQGSRVIEITSAADNVTLDGLTITNGASSGDGGGIRSDVTGLLAIRNSTISLNSATGSSGGGGGISHVSAGSVTISNSTISGNSADSSTNGGGGISNVATGSVIISNSTISANSADNTTNGGGGISNLLSGSVTIINSTIAGNSADGSSSGGGGISNVSTGSVTVSNTIIAGNRVDGDNDIAGPLLGASTENLIGNAGSAGGLINDGDGDPATGTNNIVGVDWTTVVANHVGETGTRVPTLAENGGGTQTIALLLNSPALDAGNNALAVEVDGTTPLTTDQRGLSRVIDRDGDGPATVDIGAFEAPVRDAVPRVISTSIQQGDAISAGNLSFTVQFDQQLDARNLDVNAVTLTGQLSGNHRATGLDYVATASSLTFDFQDVPDDRYTLTLDSDSFFNLAGRNLDGEAFSFPFPSNISGDGAEGGDFVVGFAADVDNFALPPLRRLSPLGSLIHKTSTAGSVATDTDTDTFTLDLDAGQVVTVVVRNRDPEGLLEPSVELLGPDAASLGTLTAAAGQDAVLQTVMAATSGTYSVVVSGANGSTGDYTLDVLLNVAEESESHGGAENNTRATAQDINPSRVDLGFGADRLAVSGRLPAFLGRSVAEEGFESGVLDGNWTTNSTNNGRIQVTGDEGTAGGDFALLMDNPNGSSRNEAIWTVDLTGVSAATLNFSYAEWEDEDTSLPAVFTGSVDGDGVAISADGTNWFTVLNSPQSNSGDWTPTSIDLAAAANTAGITLGANFQIKFQQFDNFPLTTDGRGYDEIVIRVPDADLNSDWYQVDLAAGARNTLVLQKTGPGQADVELYDNAGILLAKGVAGSGQAVTISNFAAANSAPHFIRVAGAGTDYRLVVTRNADLDGVANRDIENRQPLIDGAVVGFLVGGPPFVHMETEPNDDGVNGGSEADLPFANDLTGSFVNTFRDDYQAVVTGEITSGNDGDWDFFRFLAAPGDTLLAELSGSPSGAGTLSDPFVRLFDASGTQIASNDDSGPGRDARLLFSNFAVEGEYYLVADSVGSGTGTYTLTATLTTPTIRGVAEAFYSLPVTAGDSLTFQTLTPGDGVAQPENLLNPNLEIFDPNGASVATGINAGNENVTHTALEAGMYTVRIFGDIGTAGEYVLNVSGHTGGSPEFQVSSLSPADGSSVAVAPTELEVRFSEVVLLTTLEAGDLLINGTPALSIIRSTGDTVVFDVTGLVVDGANTIQVSGVSDVQGDALTAFSGSLTVDAVAPRVISSSIQNGDTVDSEHVFTFTFDEQLDDTDLDAADVTLVGAGTGNHTPSTFDYDSATSTLTLSFASLPEDDYTLTLISGDGAFEDLAGHDLDGEALTFPIPGNTSGDGEAGGDFEVMFSTEVTTTAFPELRASQPLGSLIDDASVAGSIGTAFDVDSYTIDLDAGQTLTLVMTSDAGLQSDLEILGTDGTSLDSTPAGAAGQTVFLQTVPAATAGTYTVNVGSAAATTTGGYTLHLILNAATEVETVGGSANDTRATAQDVDGSLIAIGGGLATRGAVMGEIVGVPPLIVGDDLESGVLDDNWTTNSTNNGRIQVTGDEGTAGGNFALLMDNPNGSSRNEAIWTVDLSGVTSPSLNFSYAEWGDESDSLPDSFTGSVDGDGVAISADGINWFTVLNSPRSDSGVWTPASIDLAAAANTAGITLGANFQIKFQQFDDFPLTTDGRGYDEISITETAELDWYSFTLDDGQSATIGLAGAGNIALFDASETLLHSGDAANNLTGVISNFTDTTTNGNADTYFVRVAGALGGYQLVITKDAAFDTEANAGSGSAQDLSGVNQVLGHVAADADSDWFEFPVTAGDNLTLTTFIPFGNAGAIQNDLDPTLELFDAAGVSVATDDHSAADGRNAVITHAALQTGVYHVRIDAAAASAGEYFLSISGNTASAADIIAPTIVSTTWNGAALPADGLVTGPALSVVLTFSEEMLPQLNTGDVRLEHVDTGDTVSVSSVDQTTSLDQATITFDGPIPEGAYTFTLFAADARDLAGNVLDGEPLGSGDDATPTGEGAEGGDYTVTIEVDAATTATEPFVRLAPLGSLVFESQGTTGLLHAPADTDVLTFFAHDGESIAAIVTPTEATATLTIGIVGIAGTFSSPAPGEPVVLPATLLTGSRMHEISVSSDEATSFTARLIRNATLEQQIGDSDDGNELPLNPAFPTVIGSSDPPVVPGTVSEGFESGDLTASTWTTSGDANWTVTGADPATGTFSAQAGTITHNQSTRLEISAVAEDGVIQFSRKVSSESDFDFLTFFIDGVQQGQWSGQETDFTTETFPVTAGQRTFTWTYTKDGSVDRGSDTAWIDDISFPGFAPTGPDVDEYTIDLTDRQSVDIVLTGHSGLAFSDQTTLQLLGTDGSTVLATSVNDFADTTIGNFDLGIFGFTAPTPGTYTVRVMSERIGQYGLHVSDGTTFEVEPNGASDALRGLVIGADPATARGLLNVDDGDIDVFSVDLLQGQRIRVNTVTPFDDVDGLPLNDLNTRLEIVHPDGSVVATDLDSADDGRNASLSFVAPADGTYKIGVVATDGVGEYELMVAEVTTVTIALTPAAVAEDGADNLVYTLSRDVTTGPLTVDFTVSGQAVFGTDYTQTGAATFTAATGMVTFAAGQATATITIDPIPDSTLEAAETVVLSLAEGGDNYRIGTGDTATGTIIDDDTATFTIADVTVNETDGTATFTVSLDNPLDIDVMIDVNYAAGTALAADFDGTPDTVTFAAGATTSQTVTVAITSDDIVEPGETFTASLAINAATPVGTRTVVVSDTATGTITDDDTATFTIDDVTVNEADGTATFTVSVDNPLDSDVMIDVNYAPGTASAADFDAATDTVTFAAGSTTPQTVTVAITNDGIVEPGETFTASLAVNAATSVGTRSVDVSDTATGTITDNDTATFTIDDVTVSEADGTATFTVSVDNPLDIDVMIDVNYAAGTAIAADFDVATDTVTFAAGSTTAQTVTVAITSDDIAELTETFTASLAINAATPVGTRSVVGSDTATGTITDDEVGGLALTIAAAAVSEDSGTTTATVTRNTDTTEDLIVNLSSSDTGEATVPTTVTIPAGQSTSEPFLITVVDDADVDGIQTVTITASVSGFTSGSDTVEVTDNDSPTSPGAVLDIDGSGGNAAAQSDGLLVFAALSGVSDTTQLTSLMAANASLTTSEVLARVNELRGSLRLDVDGNGGVSAQSDGLLIFAILSGVTDPTQLNGLIAPDAPRTVPQIIAAVQALRSPSGVAAASSPAAEASVLAAGAATDDRPDLFTETLGVSAPVPVATAVTPPNHPAAGRRVSWPQSTHSDTSDAVSPATILSDNQSQLPDLETLDDVFHSLLEDNDFLLFG